MWIVAAAVLALFAVVATVQLLRPRDLYTGTNSVRTWNPVLDAPAGALTCMRGLDIPAGTGRVELDSLYAQPAAAAMVIAGGERFRANVPAAPEGPRRLVLTIPRRPDTPASVPGAVCLRPAGGTVTLGGMPGLQGDSARPTVDGRPADVRVAVWFRAPAGERRSLLEAAPDAMRRAALFRPGWVGPWTYWLLLLVVAPLAGYAALRLLAQAAGGVRGGVPVALAIGALALVNGAAWGVLNPAFETPDEPDHFAYVQRLAETGNRPARVPTPLLVHSDEQIVAMEGNRLYSSLSHPDGKPPWLASAEEAWRARVAAGDGLRRDNGGGVSTSALHEPAYYLLAAPPYLATRGGGPFGALWAARLVSALLAAIAAAGAYGFVRELLPRAPAAIPVAAGLLVAFLPEFAFMAGALNNDWGAIATGTIALFLTARALRRGLDWRLGLGLGAVAALVPIFKATGLALYPALGLALLGVLWRFRAPALRGLAAVAAGFVAARLGWALVSGLIDPAAVPAPGGPPAAPAADGSAAFSALDHPRLLLSTIWQTFLPRLPFMTDLFPQGWPFYDTYVREGFASFGWQTMEFPAWVYRVVSAALCVVAALGLRALWQRRHGLPRHWPEAALVVVSIAAMLGGITASYVSLEPRSGELAEQGRYAFPAIAAFAGLAALGVLGAGRRRLPWVAGALVAGMVVFQWAAQALVLVRFYT